MSLDKLQERCFWQKKAIDKQFHGDDCLRAYTLRDKCGQIWGFGWIYAHESQYRVVRYCMKGRTTFINYPTAYKALKALMQDKLQ